jgi:hypothetical protein
MLSGSRKWLLFIYYHPSHEFGPASLVASRTISLFPEVVLGDWSPTAVVNLSILTSQFSLVCSKKTSPSSKQPCVINRTTNVALFWIARDFETPGLLTDVGAKTNRVAAVISYVSEENPKGSEQGHNGFNLQQGQGQQRHGRLH